MKRTFTNNFECGDFYYVDKGVINKIQDELHFANLYHFGLTCKRMDAITQEYLAREKVAVKASVLKTTHKHMDEIGILGGCQLLSEKYNAVFAAELLLLSLYAHVTDRTWPLEDVDIFLPKLQAADLDMYEFVQAHFDVKVVTDQPILKQWHSCYHNRHMAKLTMMCEVTKKSAFHGDYFRLNFHLMPGHNIPAQIHAHYDLSILKIYTDLKRIVDPRFWQNMHSIIYVDNPTRIFYVRNLLRTYFSRGYKLASGDPFRM